MDFLVNNEKSLAGEKVPGQQKIKYVELLQNW